MGRDRFEQISEELWYLRLKNKGLENQLESFRNGNAYVNQKKRYESIIRGKDVRIRQLENELAKARAQIVTNRDRWFEVAEDMEKEHEKENRKKDREIKKLEERVLDVQRQRDRALDKGKEEKAARKQAEEQLEEERGKNQKLKAQVNKDFQNSSIPSSQQGLDRKKIPNCREKTGRKPGGQPGHKGHRLTQRIPTRSIRLEDPPEYVTDPKYVETGEVKKRQKILLHVSCEVLEYTAKVFRNKENGSRVHAEFPEGFKQDISYDGTVKAFTFVMNNECNVSCRKTRRFLSEITDGQIDISEGTINKLSREFSEKTEEERNAILEELMTSPVLNVDFTNADMNGESRQVLIIASPSADAQMYIAREHKGHKGIEGTPLENYCGTLVHDHDRTFYGYGMDHQECMQHNDRYLVGAAQNEPDLTWPDKMRGLIKEMNDYRNGLGEAPLDPKVVSKYERRYDRILKLAEKEYQDHPPNAYYREGYNLYKRMVEFKEYELRFLHDKSIPSNNSLAERMARIFKRKQRQVMAFRSDDGLDGICDALGKIHYLRRDGLNVYAKIADIFNRKSSNHPEVRC